jgi:hypothetical protein
VLDFLVAVYNARAMRYDRFSAGRNQFGSFEPAALKSCVERLRRYEPDGLPALLMYLNENDELDKFALGDATGWDNDTCRQFFQIFTSKVRALRATSGRKVIKTPLMVAALKEIEG